MKLVGKALVAVMVLFGLIAVVAVVTGAEAPEAEFELEDIVIEDNGEEVAISIDDVDEYVMGEIEDEIGSLPHVEMCLSVAYRAALLGISEVWENEVPSRDDIRIISSLPEPGSAFCFQYITGTGPSMENLGEFKIVLLDGTEVENLSIGHLHKLSENITAEDWVFKISSFSTGENYVVEVKEDVFEIIEEIMEEVPPEDFFELYKKVVFEGATSEEEEEIFEAKWMEIRDMSRGNEEEEIEPCEDYELFEGLEEPPPSSSVVVILIAIIVAIGVLAVKI